MDEREPPEILLTTTGRITGNPHVVRLWFVKVQGKFYVTAYRKPASDWFLNLRRKTRVKLKMDNMEFIGDASVVVDEELRRKICLMRHEKYKGLYGEDPSDCITNYDIVEITTRR